MTSLYQIEGNKLRPASRHKLEQERLIESWVMDDPSILGLDVLVIGHQVQTEHRKIIDLLALDRSGNVVVIELKKDRTPREVVAQILDYGSWVGTLATPDIYEIGNRYLAPKATLASAFRDCFDEPIPEQLGANHSLLIVASELDPASKRIVEYLSETYNVAINTAFFNVFEAAGQKWLTTDFLLDQNEVEERSERRTRPPWSGYYFVNAGVKDDWRRSWNDMRKFGFLSAGGGKKYSRPLERLEVGDEIFVYNAGEGYLGHGIVTSESQPASDFETEYGPLFDQDIEGKGILREGEGPDNAEYAVGVNWTSTVERDKALRYTGIFANQNIVCKLYDVNTVEFLKKELEV